MPFVLAMIVCVAIAVAIEFLSPEASDGGVVARYSDSAIGWEAGWEVGWDGDDGDGGDGGDGD